jgi:hypothetical protein
MRGGSMPELRAWETYMKRFSPDRLRKLAWSLLIFAILVSLLVFMANMTLYGSYPYFGVEIKEPNSQVGMFLIFMGVFTCIAMLREARKVEKSQKES